MSPTPSSASLYVKFFVLIHRFTFNKDEMDEKPALPVRSPPVKKKSNSSPAPKPSGTSAPASHGKPGKPKTSEESPEIKSPSVSCSEMQDALKSSILLQGITAGPTLSLTWAAQRLPPSSTEAKALPLPPKILASYDPPYSPPPSN